MQFSKLSFCSSVFSFLGSLSSFGFTLFSSLVYLLVSPSVLFLLIISSRQTWKLQLFSA
jgi:hypothetical protein